MIKRSLSDGLARNCNALCVRWVLALILVVVAGCIRTGTADAVSARAARNVVPVRSSSSGRWLEQSIIVTNNRDSTIYVDLCSKTLKRKASEAWIVVTLSACIALCPGPTQTILAHDSAAIAFGAYEQQNLMVVGPNGKLSSGVYRVEMQIGYGRLRHCAELSDVHLVSSSEFQVVGNGEKL